MFEVIFELGFFFEIVYWYGGDLDGYGCEYFFLLEKNLGVVLFILSGGKEFVMLGWIIMS